MAYVPLHEKFPEIAEKETRSFTALNSPDLPKDDYGLIEAYCDEPDCDCRRVFFNVLSRKQRKVVAVIAYGWASRKYYGEWLGFDDPNAIAELQGPALNTTSHQSRLAPALLQMVTEILKDKRYVDRLKRHYAMFKEVIAAEADAEAAQGRRPAGPMPAQSIARNAPCPCGSGKKYKYCCGRSR
ncbi:MAG: hypothetical protein CVU38_05450 [Chloroflexi bacterium HGW-Chloroflexi-1]|nr:MAG: hypothetical protein CVU38_05450 [Chloroflexi bacterium HGW-Chloroflexi-1]